MFQIQKKNQSPFSLLSNPIITAYLILLLIFFLERMVCSLLCSLAFCLALMAAAGKKRKSSALGVSGSPALSAASSKAAEPEAEEDVTPIEDLMAGAVAPTATARASAGAVSVHPTKPLPAGQMAVGSSNGCILKCRKKPGRTCPAVIPAYFAYRTHLEKDKWFDFLAFFQLCTTSRHITYAHTHHITSHHIASYHICHTPTHRLLDLCD
jgi:hypothetical protein